MTHFTRRTAGLLVVVTGLVAASGCGPAAAPTPTVSPQDRLGNPDAYNVANDPAIGPASAKVVIQEYGDYSCPACAAWEQKGIRKQLIQKYGDQIRFVWMTTRC